MLSRVQRNKYKIFELWNPSVILKIFSRFHFLQGFFPSPVILILEGDVSIGLTHEPAPSILCLLNHNFWIMLNS